jgi:hypothetical protein
MTSGACSHHCRCCSRWGQVGSMHTKWAALHVAATCMNSGFIAAGGTGIEPASCGFGALGALSSVVQGYPNRPWMQGFSRCIVQRRPSTSSRYVVSFVVNAQAKPPTRFVPVRPIHSASLTTITFLSAGAPHGHDLFARDEPLDERSRRAGAEAKRQPNHWLIQLGQKLEHANR